MSHHTDIIEKGAEMNHAERSAEIPSPRTGICATLRGLLSATGSGAPSPRRPAPLRRLTLTVLVAAFALALLAPSAALAAFTRPFLHQITGTPPTTPFSGPSSLATDAKDNLWVSDPGASRSHNPPYNPPYPLDEFSSAGAFLKTLAIEGPKRKQGGTPGEYESLFTRPQSLAIDRSTGSIYATGEHTENNGLNYVEVFDGAGAFSKFWGPLNGAAHVAIDNSTEPSAGSVYVSGSEGIEKFNASGVPVEFKGVAPYIVGNKITAGGPFRLATGEPGALAVDSHGDIYIVNSYAPGVAGDGQTKEEMEYLGGVDEFSPEGVFIRAFHGTETPGLEAQASSPHGHEGFGGEPNGVAVDSVSGHLVVSVYSQFENREFKIGEASPQEAPKVIRSVGAVDEFDIATGKFLGQITETSSGHPLRSAFEMTFDSLGDLYVVSDTSAERTPEHAVNVYGPGHYFPSFELADAGERREHSALLSGSVDPETLPLGDCHFEYVTEAAFAANLANEVQAVTLTGATGGTFMLTFEGQSTAALPYNATAAEVQSALEGLSSIGSGNVAVTGPAGGPYAVEFKGSLAHTGVPLLSAGSLALTPPLGASMTVVVTTEGDDGWVPAANAPCVPAAGEIPTDTSFHHVQAEVAGLTAGVTYRYRLAATTSGVLGGTASSAPLAFTAPHAPRVDSTSADNVSSTFADLHARIDPLGAETSYRFQYVSQQQFEQTGFSEPSSTPEVDVGPGGSTGGVDAAVLAHIGGLAPATVYRFRVLASNECEPAARPGGMCATEGEAATFTTLSPVSPGLPDGRAYELVTPPDKGAAQDMFGGREPPIFKGPEEVRSSESGNGFLLNTRASFGPSPAAGISTYVFSRTPAGWAYTSLSQPGLGLQNIGAFLADPSDFSRVAFGDYLGALAGAEGARFTDLLGPAGGPYTTLHADPPVREIGLNTGDHTEFVGASHDLSHVVLQSRGHAVIPGGPAEAQDAGSEALYEYSGGELMPLNVNSSGSLLSRCGAILGLGEYEGMTHNAVSADGSRAFITAPDPGGNDGTPSGPGCWNKQAEVKEGAKPQFDPPQLYMRSGGNTVEVSAPQAGAPEVGAAHPASYVGASEDGSRVFFVSEGELTKDDAGIHDLELYEYDAEKPEGERLTRISAGESGKAAAGVEFVPAVSADGSAVYFTATAQLTSDAPPTVEAKPLVEGTVDLYRYDTVTGATTYVAMVNPNDYPDNHGAPFGNRVGLEAQANWYTTPDGRYLVFGSVAPTAQLTGGSSNVQAPGSKCVFPGGQGGSNGHCAELYRYDSAAAPGARLACVSCNPSGEQPTANAAFTSFGPGERDASPLRPISDDGSYVFFESRDPLVPQDVNATSDVYEWRAGTVSLISSGQDPNPTGFLGTTPSGHDVFFGTHARLVPQDTDREGDVYDARIGGGFPVQGGRGPCEGNACENPPAAPIDATPGSLTFSGPGNLAPLQVKPAKLTGSAGKKTAKCKTGVVKKKGKCVKHRTKKSKKAKKSIRRAR